MNKSDAMVRYLLLLDEARRSRHAHPGQKDMAYIRLKRQLCDLPLDVPYEKRVRALCDALQY